MYIIVLSFYRKVTVFSLQDIYIKNTKEIEEEKEMELRYFEGIL